MWEGPVLEWMFLVVSPNLVLKFRLPIGNTLMKNLVAVISGLLLELLKTMASAGQVFTLSCHVPLPCQSLWKYTGRFIWGQAQPARPKVSKTQTF